MKHFRAKGKISIRQFLQAFLPGDRVHLTLEPAIHKGMFHPRFSGKNGIIKKKTGSCYEVVIKDINKEKVLVAHPVHLRKQE